MYELNAVVQSLRRPLKELISMTSELAENEPEVADPGRPIWPTRWDTRFKKCRMGGRISSHRSTQAAEAHQNSTWVAFVLFRGWAATGDWKATQVWKKHRRLNLFSTQSPPLEKLPFWCLAIQPERRVAVGRDRRCVRRHHQQEPGKMSYLLAVKAVVLIVEDEPLVRMLATDVVEEAGFEVLEAGNADEAVRILESRPDVRIVLSREQGID
jgi:hypothetical protein